MAFSIHLIGLGGTGANIVECFIKSSEMVKGLKANDALKVNCLVLDVADDDIDSLESARSQMLEGLREMNVPAERVRVRTMKTRFSNPEGLFEFLDDYPKYLQEREGISVPKDYKPWVTTAMEIPPLTGGVGRRRALAKAIYNFNYYTLGILEQSLSGFVNDVQTAVVTPIVFIVFGMGGGSGGGMVFDLARHLKRRLPPKIPIVGLGILPCDMDQPQCFSGAYAALNELILWMDSSANSMLVDRYGASYLNPFTTFLLMPLAPTYLQSKEIRSAHRVLDEAIVDILVNSLKFDLADLFVNIGATEIRDDRCLHLINTIRFRYPIEDNINLVKIKLQRLQKLKRLREMKNEILSYYGQLMILWRGWLAGIYRNILIAKGIYEEEKFPDSLNNMIYSDGQAMNNIQFQIKSLEKKIDFLVEEIRPPLLTVGEDAEEGTVEAKIRSEIKEALDTTTRISEAWKKYADFSVKFIKEVNMDLALARAEVVKPKQTELLKDLVEVVKLCDSLIGRVVENEEIRSLAENLRREMSRSASVATPESTEMVEEIHRQSSTLFQVVGSMADRPSAEVRKINQFYSLIMSFKETALAQIEEMKRQDNVLRDTIARTTRKRQEDEGQMARLKPWDRGKKKFMKEELKRVEQELRVLNARLQEQTASTNEVQSLVDRLAGLEGFYTVNSDYRKVLQEILELEERAYQSSQEIAKERGFFDFTPDILESEKNKILSKILHEEEHILRDAVGIMTEIIDRDQHRSNLRACLQKVSFRNNIGVSQKYRTDLVWVTVATQSWEEKLTDDIITNFADLVGTEANTKINVRPISCDDPWATTFYVISSRARLEDLFQYKDLKIHYDRSDRSKKLLAHSFLLEQNLLASKDMFQRREG